MTRNQIEYWKLKHEEKASARTARIQSRYNRETVAETKRANRARERETNRINTINAALQKARDEAQKNHWDWSRAETAAHNREVERETAQHNRSWEQLTAAQQEIDKSRVDLGYYQSSAALEGQRYSAGASYANVAMMDRANVARQAEINRANLINEGISQYNAETQRLNAGTQQAQAMNAARNAATQRLNYNLDVEKWNQAILPKTRSEIELLGQQAATSAAQRDRWTEQSHVERVNAFSNTIGQLTRIGALVGGAL